MPSMYEARVDVTFASTETSYKRVVKNRMSHVNNDGIISVFKVLSRDGKRTVIQALPFDYIKQLEDLASLAWSAEQLTYREERFPVITNQ